MKLDPKLFKMEAKVWRDPVAEKKAIEEQNRKRAEAKKKADEDKLARKVKAEREKLERKQLAETGRLVQNEKTDQYLARLKVDVARLEAKRDADKAVSNKSSGNPGAEDPKTSAGTTLTAAEIKLRQEVEFERKKRENEKELAALAEKKRRELLEFQASIGMTGGAGLGPVPPKAKPGSLHDDPLFSSLSKEDKRIVEAMTPEKRHELGFGPYQAEEEAELKARLAELRLAHPAPGAEPTIEERFANFVIRGYQEPLTGYRIVEQFPPLELEIEVDIPLEFERLHGALRQMVDETILQRQQELETSMIEGAIMSGANGLLEFFIDGPRAVEQGENIGQLVLVASGIPVRLAPSQAPLTGLPRTLPPHHSVPLHRRKTAPAHASSWNNGGAGWHDPPALDLHDDPLFGMPRAGLHGVGGVGQNGARLDGWGGGAPARHGVATGWGQNRGQHGWGQSAQPLGWSANDARGGFGQYPPGPLQAGPSFQHRPQGPSRGVTVPSGLDSLPWGAQAYIRSVQARQEEELREAARARTGANPASPAMDDTLPTAQAGPSVAPPRHDPALFGNSFPHPYADTAVGVASPREHAFDTFAMRPSQPGPTALGGGGGGWSTTRAYAMGVSNAHRYGQTTTDPDNGRGWMQDHAAGGPSAKNPWSPGPMPW